MPVFQATYRIPLMKVHASKPNYPNEKAIAFGTWEKLPREAQELAAEAWKQEDPTLEVWSVVASVSGVAALREHRQSLLAEADAVQESIWVLVSEVLAGWTLEEATQVVATKTVRKNGRSKSVPITALEELAAIAGWSQPWKHLNAAADAPEVDADLADHIGKQYRKTLFR